MDNLVESWYYFAIQEATKSHFYDWKEDSFFEIWTAMRPNPNWALLERPESRSGNVVYDVAVVNNPVEDNAA